MFIYDASMRYQQEGVAAADHRGQGIRQRVVARLGRERRRCCWACAPSSPKASSAFIARTWSAWACCRSSSWTAQNRESLGLTGFETYAIEGIGRRSNRAANTPRARRPRTAKVFEAIARIDTPVEAEYYRSGGILPYVLQQIAR